VEGDTAVGFPIGGHFPHGTVVASTPDSLIWIGSERTALLYSPGGGAHKSITLPLGTEDYVTWMSTDWQGDVWIGSADGVVMLFSDATLVSIRQLPNGTSGALVDRQGSAWLNTPKGIFKIQKQVFQGGSLVEYDTRRGFPDLTAFASLEDREGNLWFGTYSKGLLKLSDMSLQWMPIHQNAHLLVVDSDGHCWLPEGGGIREVWIEHDGEWHSVVHRPRGRSQDERSSLLVFDRHGQLWEVSASGLRCYRMVKDLHAKTRVQLVRTLGVDKAVSQGTLLSSYVDSENRIWYSTEGLVVVADLSSPRRPDLHLAYPRDISLPSVRAIFQDHRGDIWLGDYSKGLVRLRGGKVEESWHLTMVGGFREDAIRCFGEDREGRLWIGTRYIGVLIYDKGTFQNISMKDGLVSNDVQSLARDNMGSMWLATSLGLQCIKSDTVREVETISETVGHVVTFCAVASNGLVWVTDDLERLGAYDPSKRKRNIVRPPVYISRFTVNDSTITTERGLVFSHDQNNCSIQYVGLSFRDESAVRYQYRLNDAEWSRPTRSRSVSFAALSPGEYSFEVRAVNSDGLVSAPPARVSFTILPPYWQRWWFVVLVMCVVSGLLYTAYLYRVRQLLRVERLRTRIAADLHDDIGASLTRISLLSDIAKDEARRLAPNLANIAERIGNDARELLDAVSTLVWSIDPRHDKFNDLLIHMKEFAQEAFETKGIACQFSAEPSLGDLQIPVEMRRNFLLVYKEAVNNVVRHSQCTETRVEVHLRNGELLLSVADNGIGFSEKDTKRGHGLANMHSRATASGARLFIDSGEGKGTRVEITIPLK